MTAIQLLAASDGLQMAAMEFSFQTVGMIVVFTCLSFLAIVLGISGKIASSITSKKKQNPSGGKPAPVQARPAAPAAGGNAAAMTLTPELIAVISAAVHSALGGVNHRILDIKQSATSAYSASGRTEIFASHRITPTRRG